MEMTMGRKKYFLSQKHINSIIRKYGGLRKYTLRERLSEYDCITYTEKQNRYKLLSINRKTDQLTDEPYIMVHISDENGKIIQRDRYDY